MREVANVNCMALFSVLRSNGLDPAAVLEGGPALVDRLSRRRGRCDWQEFVSLTKQVFQRVGESAALERIGRAGIDPVNYGDVRRLTSRLMSVRALYWAQSKFIGRHLFSNVRFAFQRAGREEVHMDNFVRHLFLTKRNRNVEFEKILDVQGGEQFDRIRVFQVLNNLIANAVESVETAAPSSPRVRFHARSEDDRLIFVVSDNGLGIEPDRLPCIGQLGHTTKQSGHGFGVFFCRKTVEDELGGRFSVHSDGPGHGAQFTVEIPQASG